MRRVEVKDRIYGGLLLRCDGFGVDVLKKILEPGEDRIACFIGATAIQERLQSLKDGRAILRYLNDGSQNFVRDLDGVCDVRFVHCSHILSHLEAAATVCRLIASSIGVDAVCSRHFAVRGTTS